MSTTWHLLTGEYPPDCGGVGDYTAALAAALADAGDAVHVWTPAAAESAPRITLHRLPDGFGPGSRRELARGFAAAPGTVVLQYVPNALGGNGANLPFCLWFSRLRRTVSDIRVMVHEPYFYFVSPPWAPTNALALAQRVMVRLVLRGARIGYQSTETWRRYLPSLVTLPIPSSIPGAAADPAIADARRLALAGVNTQVIGHFGTYGAHVADELRAILPALIQRLPGIRLALLGANGPAFLASLGAGSPVAARAWSPGRLDPDALAAALRGCDLLIQPFPDGITTRRTSVMAGLKNGVPTVSTEGELTEPVWRETGAVALAPAADVAAFVDAAAALLADAVARGALGRRAAAVYADRFSIDRTVSVLRSAPAA